jgi:hypothetical protein
LSVCWKKDVRKYSRPTQQQLYCSLKHFPMRIVHNLIAFGALAGVTLLGVQADSADAIGVSVFFC